MSLQTAFQLIALVGVLMTASGGFGAYYYGKVEEAASRQQAQKIQNQLQAQIAKFQSTLDAKTDLIFHALKVKEDVWIAVETNTVPVTAAYLLLLFKSDKGRIGGKVRVKGSDKISYFSTTSNDVTPVAVPNLWVPEEKKYKSPIVVEFTVTEKTIADSNLNIFTFGWVDDLGQEPH